MSIRDGHASFRLCDESIDMRMTDSSDGTWSRSFADETRDGELSLYIEAYGERSADGGDDTAVDAYDGIFVLEQILYAAPQDQVRGCEAPAPDHLLLARGNEPFWALEVREATLSWKQPDLPDAIELGKLDMENLEGSVRYRAAGDSHALELLVDMQSCQDSMSGELFAFTARAVLDGREFNGCARLAR